MFDRKRALLGVCAGAGVLALSAHFLWPFRQQEKPRTTTVAKEREAESPTPPAPPQAEPEVSPRAGGDAPAERAPPERAPGCVNDAQCRGPHTADCVQATCRDGKCAYDASACECRSASDCDDGDPCTRNHCFARTQKCIYIPGECG